MRYWLDEEFIERGPDYPLELMSIGIVSQDKREYYAQSVEFHPENASPWVIEHVFAHMTLCPYPAGTSRELLPDPVMQMKREICIHERWPCNDQSDQSRSHCPWRTREQIRDNLLTFMDPLLYGKPEIWTYYGCYDHVVFCQLFGTMMDLPRSYPMHTMDLKQWCKMLGDPRLPEQDKGEHNALADAHWNRVAWEFLDKLALDNELLR